MPRPKGSLNKKTIESLKSIGEDGQPVAKDEGRIQEMQEQIEKLTSIISELTDKIAQKEDPVKTPAVESQYDLKDLDTKAILSKTEIARLETEKEEAIRELRGIRKNIASILGGTVTAYEKSTGKTGELYKRLAMSHRALAEQGPPKITQEQRNKFKKEYDVLTEELRNVLPSTSSCWRVGTPEYHDAIDKLNIIHSKYQNKITRWQNIGKLLDPDNPTLWNLDRLAKP